MSKRPKEVVGEGVGGDDPEHLAALSTARLVELRGRLRELGALVEEEGFHTSRCYEAAVRAGVNRTAPECLGSCAVARAKVLAYCGVRVREGDE